MITFLLVLSACALPHFVGATVGELIGSVMAESCTNFMGILGSPYSG